jgi:PIN domain nuclease of toxin-antitoxin system
MASSVEALAVLDASALLAYLQGESGSERVEEALDHSAISTVNLAEVLTVALHKRGEAPSSLRPQLLALGIQALDFTVEDAQETAALWTQTRTHGLALGDRACLALGKRLGAKVLTAETQRDWRKLGLKGVEVVSIRN